jgi:predicted dinucleotide-binding enzyme
MKIGIVGAGRVGHALAVRLAGAGHEVMLSNSRGEPCSPNYLAYAHSRRRGIMLTAPRLRELIAGRSVA